MQRTILNNFDSNSNAQVFRTIIKIAYFFDFYKFFEQKKNDISLCRRLCLINGLERERKFEFLKTFFPLIFFSSFRVHNGSRQTVFNITVPTILSVNYNYNPDKYSLRFSCNLFIGFDRFSKARLFKSDNLRFY